MCYLDQLANMPENIAAIVSNSYDDTGRPLSDDSYAIMVVNLLNLCDDWEDYKRVYSLADPAADMSSYKTVSDLTMQWACYIGGIKRLENYMTAEQE